MSGRADEFDAQLAERGDDRPGLDDLEVDDFSALLRGSDADDEDDEDDDPEGADDDADDGYPEDALDEEIDLVLALYREDGGPAAAELTKDLANDFDELIEQLRRVPGDAGAAGVVVIDSDFFVLVRVRGKRVEVLLSDSLAASDWPIARDAADFLGEEIPDDDEDAAPVGDFAMFADAGLSAFEMERICSDLDADPIDLVAEIAEKLGFGTAYKKVVSTLDL